jgi:hypothetical protein
MKTLIFSILLSTLFFAACNNGTPKNHTAENPASAATVEPDKKAETPGTSIKGLLNGYMQIKNGLANDNGNDAATGGKAFNDALAKVDKSSMSAGQKKSFEDIADDAKEMAEHISTNAGKIAHQREHFYMLSKDMYDVVKTFGAGQTLYQDFCPMYNNKKGATWLSETKDIKNPYLGNEMPDCGSVKETLH